VDEARALLQEQVSLPLGGVADIRGSVERAEKGGLLEPRELTGCAQTLFAFSLARKTGKRVTSASKYTIQKATDGLFEQVAREVAVQHPEVPHNSELFDALLGKIIMAPEKFQIVLVLSEYGDFLSDMACGLALMMGFVLVQNFDSPYRAESITDFWRRWHISLSTWLRDYLYIPLGGNRLGAARTYVNLMIVMLLGGLWHGASWNFVLWGAIHGGMLAFERSQGQNSVYRRLPRPARPHSATRRDRGRRR